MNLLTLLFRLPLLPLQGFVRLAQVIEEEAERELADPARVRHELEEVEQAEASGEISEQEAAEREHEAVTEYTQVREGAAAADSDAVAAADSDES
jgi:Gas vesicle protein G